MKKVILHIGRHKSGTSSLQQFLVHNESALAKRGYSYPTALRRPIAHHLLARHYHPKMNEPLSQEVLQDFWTEVDAAENIIISSEAFQNIDPKKMQKDFENYDLEIVVYIREQIGYFLSAYSQAIKARKVTWTMHEYEEKVFNATYINFLKRWEEAFPNAKLNVRVFSKKSLINGDIIEDFLVSSGICTLDEIKSFTPFEDDKNPSIGGSLLEFKRLLNFTDYETKVKKGKLYRVLRQMTLKHQQYKLDKSLPEDLYQKMYKKYSETNTKISKKYLKDALILEENVQFVEEYRMSEKELHQIFDDMHSEDKKMAKILKTAYFTFIMEKSVL